MDFIKEILKQIDGLTSDSFLNYLDNLIVTKKYLIFNDSSFIPVVNTVDSKSNIYENIVKIPYEIKGKVKDNKIKKYIDDYYQEINTENKINIDILLYLRNSKSKSKLRDIKNIIDNPIMLKIHKREKILFLLKKSKINKEYLYQFVEKLLSNGYEKIEELLINNTTTKQIMKSNPLYYIFKDFQIKNREYTFIFDPTIQDSQYIRKINKETKY